MKTSLLLAVFLLSSTSFAEICGNSDDRVPSADPKVGRLVKAGETQGCTAALVGKNCLITIGACAENRDYVEFNVPASIGGVPQASSAEDRYDVIKSETKFSAQGIGNQWAVMKLAANKITGKAAGDVQGFYNVAKQKSHDNDPIRVVSYGYALGDTYEIKYDHKYNANPYADVLHYAQAVSYGKLVKAGIFLIPEIVEHNADTSYGSWGAPIISQVTNEIVGISTHGGCQAEYVVSAGARYTNAGTSVTGNSKFKKAIAACLAQ
ncbi:MAG: trypsin-like serine protease [Bacillota bacterium]